MRMRKINAFTLAELLVIMAVLAVLMAAFAPMFTSRYTNIATGAVWRKVPADNNGHIYSDAPNKFLLQPSFIGISPQTPEEAKNNYKPYSKVIINSTANNQKQVDFNYNGEKIGSLYALNKNILMGGNYPKALTGIQNTAFGYEALNNLSSGKDNTAVGFQALKNLESGTDNTAIGFNAAQAGGSKISDKNVIVGSVNFRTESDDNVVIRNKQVTLPQRQSLRKSVVIGDDTVFFTKGRDSEGNVVVGHNAAIASGLPNDTRSSLTLYNTAVGAFAETPLGQNNTSIGYFSGVDLSSTYNNSGFASNVTIISNRRLPNAPNTSSTSVFSQPTINNDSSHVFIGDSTSYGPAALEVHSNNNDSRSQVVIVNGDLIVRGQTYLNSNDNIVAMTVDPYNGKLVLSDHTERNRRMRKEDPTKDDGRGMIHEKYAGYEGCVCSASSNISTYNWTNFTANNNSIYLPFEAYNTNLHYGKYMYNGNDADSKVILDAAHMRSVQDSCCPNLQSDARLKNIGEKFTPSYDELLKLAIYNYSYKTEGKKPTRVGVIAQDLKKIFPNAVSKDQNGYLKIRWDEMFYAMVNAIKDLNAKVQDLVAKVETNKAKINNLKADNKKLEQKLDDLAKEIAKLEK